MEALVSLKNDCCFSRIDSNLIYQHGPIDTFSCMSDAVFKLDMTIDQSSLMGIIPYQVTDGN